MQRFIENFRQAFLAVKDNRMRSIMSIVAIAVGVAAVTIVGTVSQSGRDYIFSELDSYGLSSLWIYRNWDVDNPFATVREGSGITNSDLQALKQSQCCPNVIAYSPAVYPKIWMVNLKVGNNFNKTGVSGVDQFFLQVNNDKIISGRNFRENDMLRRSKVALIGLKAAKKLFADTHNLVGRNVRMGETQYTIIGVLEDKKRDMLNAVGATGGFDENNRMLIPYTLYQQMLGSKDIHTLRAEADSLEHVQAALNQITEFLKIRNNNKYKYTMESMLPWINTSNKILRMISLIGGFAAFIALTVGGVGIFNIMTSSVMDRTSEIGVLKALGASNQDVLTQYLIEAGLVSITGGVLGTIVGMIALTIAFIYFSIPVAFAWNFLFIGVFISILIGLSAGYYPAKRAADLPPAVALRYS